MSTLRVSNIEAKADVSSPSVHEKIKVTNSEGDVLVHIDGATSGISTVGINTTVKTFDVDSNQNIDFVGNLTASNITVTGTLSYDDVTNIDSVGVITARSGLEVTSGGLQVVAGNVGIDQSNPTNKLEVEGSASVARFVGNRTDALGPRLSLAKSRGSTSGSATIVQDGDEIGQIMFKGADGTDADSTGAAIIARVNGTPGVNDMPGALTFLTTNDGNNSPTERLRITSDGKMGLGTQTPGQTLSISGSSAGLGIYNTGNSHGNVYFYKDGTAKGWLKYRGNDDKLVIGNVTDAINVLSSGNVGVNCTPLSKFQVNTATNANIALTSDGSEAAIEAFNDAGSANVPLRIRGSEIKFKIDGTQRARLYYSSNSAVLALGDESNTAGHIRLEAKASENQIHGRSNHPITFLINTSEKLRIDSNGRIGINANPTTYANSDTALGLLIRNGASGSEHTFLDIQNEASESGRIRFVDGDNGIGGQIYFSHNSPRDGVGGNCMGFFTANNVLRMQVTTSGVNVSGSTDGVLNLDTTDGRGSFVRFKENGTTKAWVGCAEGMGGGTSSPDQDDLGLRATGNILFSSNGGERLRIEESGRVVIHGNGTIRSSWPGAVCSMNNLAMMDAGSGFSWGLRANSGDTQWCLERIVGTNSFSDSNIKFRVYNNGNYSFAGTNSSDRDIKENIQDISGTSLNLIDQLRPRTFNFKESEGYSTEPKTGFVAQEIGAVIPSIVNGTDGQKDMGVDYNGLVAHLVKAVQELKAENDAMRARLDAAGL